MDSGINNNDEVFNLLLNYLATFQSFKWNSFFLAKRSVLKLKTKEEEFNKVNHKKRNVPTVRIIPVLPNFASYFRITIGQ